MHLVKSFPNLNKVRQMLCYYVNPIWLPTYWLLVQLPSITSLVNWFPGVSCCQCRTQNGQKNFVAKRLCLTSPTNSPPTFLVGGSTYRWWYLDPSFIEKYQIWLGLDRVPPKTNAFTFLLEAKRFSLTLLTTRLTNNVVGAHIVDDLKTSYYCTLLNTSDIYGCTSEVKAK